MRLEVRHWAARRKLGSIKDIWPILPGSEKPPSWWKGWPEGKKFAFVLTHDVEGSFGLKQCSRLMHLEGDMGFRSSFNFIPEGEYTVSKDLRDELVRNRFEVGVHDLKHDGWLYKDREHFAESAVAIRNYMREWNAVGFRSGFMLHNLEWLHDLQAEYDASTFDTDPFEPQPEGEGTIFPFWVAGNGGDAGYVELPYTLPQDSTMFLVLKERTPDIWKRKLDWIATHGGMALVNVHPDYVDFESGRRSSTRFPVSLYREFLEYARNRHGDQYWHALPSEVAEHVRKSL